jgi:hypothetical protein
VVLVGVACVAFAFGGRGSIGRVGSASDVLDAGLPVLGDGFGFWRSFGFAFVFGDSGEFVPRRDDVLVARDGCRFVVFDDCRGDGRGFGCVVVVLDGGFASRGVESFGCDAFRNSDDRGCVVLRADGG